jgi:5-methylcytosine-specific restriction endonuclease McrA
MSEITRGEKNPRWIKDRSRLKIKRAGIEKFLLDEWRKQVFERDDYTCLHCDERGGKLNADHILPVYLFPELILEISNGRTLCKKCHKKTPTYGYKVLKMKREDFEMEVSYS